MPELSRFFGVIIRM